MSLTTALSQRGASKERKGYRAWEMKTKKRQMQRDFTFLLKEENNPLIPQGRKETVGVHSAPYLIPAQWAPCIR